MEDGRPDNRNGRRGGRGYADTASGVFVGATWTRFEIGDRWPLDGARVTGIRSNINLTRVRRPTGVIFRILA